MRILNIGGLYLAEALRRRGHQVLTVGFSGGHDVLCASPKSLGALLEPITAAGFTPEVLFYADDGNMPLLTDPETSPVPGVFFSIDTYCNPWHVLFAHGFDLILAAQKDFLPIFIADGLPGHWFPLFCNTVCEPLPFESRDIPVSFVGTLQHANNPNRKPFLDAFRKLHPLAALSGDFLQIFTRSRVVLNQTAFSEINFRCFEAMACGAALLMESCGNGLTELFSPGENILPTYPRDNAVAAAAVAAASAADPQALARIAENGRSLVADRHTADVRAATLEAYFAVLLHTVAQTPRLKDEQSRRRTLVRAGFAALADDLTNPALLRHKEFFLRLAR